jgi:hypothetical protein
MFDSPLPPPPPPPVFIAVDDSVATHVRVGARFDSRRQRRRAVVVGGVRVALCRFESTRFVDFRLSISKVLQGAIVYGAVFKVCFVCSFLFFSSTLIAVSQLAFCFFFVIVRATTNCFFRAKEQMQSFLSKVVSQSLKELKKGTQLDIGIVFECILSAFVCCC